MLVHIYIMVLVPLESTEIDQAKFPQFLELKFCGVCLNFSNTQCGLLLL